MLGEHNDTITGETERSWHRVRTEAGTGDFDARSFIEEYMLT